MSEVATTAIPAEPTACVPAIGGGRLDRIAPAGDRSRIEDCLAEFLDDARRRFAANPHLAPLYDRAAEFVLNGGKRLRPRLALATYRIVRGAGEPPPPPAWSAAAALELYHAFMLVHDDLIDGSLTRRGRDSLHEALRRDADRGDDGPAGRKRAADLGMVAGDLLFAMGQRLIAHAGLDDATHGRVQRLVADMLLETGLGQSLDILYADSPIDRIDESLIFEAYLRKTARYTVTGPLRMGATLAGAPAAVGRSLGRYGDLLGLAYQLRNDLDALAGDPEREPLPDLDGGKRTWLLWAAHRRLGEAGRRALDLAMADPVGPARRCRLLGLIRASGALDDCAARARLLADQAAEALDDSPLDPGQRRAFQALAGLLNSSAPPGSLPAAEMATAPYLDPVAEGQPAA